MKNTSIAGLIGRLEANYEEIERILNDRFYSKDARCKKIKERIAKCKELTNAIFEKI